MRARGALLIPDKKIELAHHGASSDGAGCGRTRADATAPLRLGAGAASHTDAQQDAAEQPAGSPCTRLSPPRYATALEQVDGILALFRPASDADFDMRQARMVEMLARRIARLLQSAYDSVTGLLTRAAFEQRALAVLGAAPTEAHCVAYADVDRLHVINENYGMHVGDAAIACVAATIRAHLPASAAAARISGDRFALFFPDTEPAAVEPFLQELRRDRRRRFQQRREGYFTVGELRSAACPRPACRFHTRSRRLKPPAKPRRSEGADAWRPIGPLTLAKRKRTAR